MSFLLGERIKNSSQEIKFLMSIIRLYIEVLLLFLANLMLSENAGIKQITPHRSFSVIWKLRADVFF